MKPGYRKLKKQLPFNRSRTWHAASSLNDNLVISFSEDDSESEHEDSKTEGQNQELGTGVSNRIQRVKLATDSSTILSQKSLNNRMVATQARGSLNSLPMPSDHTTIVRNSTCTGVSENDIENCQEVGYSHSQVEALDSLPKEIAVQQKECGSQNFVICEDEAQMQRNDRGKCHVSSSSHNQSGSFPLAMHQKEFWSQNNLSKRKPSSFHHSICDSADKNRDSSTGIYTGDVVANSAGFTLDQQEVKRLKLGQHSHLKLMADGNIETKRLTSQHDASHHDAVLVANGNGTHGFLPQLDPSNSTPHDADGRFFSPSSQVLTDSEKVQRSDFQVVESAATILPSNGIYPRQRQQDFLSRSREQNFFSADISSSHKQLNMSVAQVASAGLVPNFHQLASHREDVSTKASAVVLEPLPDTPNINQPTMPSFSGYDFMDINSLMKLEELKDKELEEAREIRRRCELAEKKALKAYREAQRALMDANERCSFLYRRRELFSAHLRTLMMDGCNTLISSAWPNRTRTQLDMIEKGMLTDTFPSSGQEYAVLDKELSLKIGDRDDVRNDENADKRLGVQCGVDVCNAENREHLHVEPSKQLVPGHSLSSEFCFNSNAQRLEAKSDSVLAEVNHSSILPDMSAKEVQHDLLVCSDSSGLACDDENFADKKMAANLEAEMISISDNAHDFELEATLRSKLCARFSRKSSNLEHDHSQVATIITKVDANVLTEKEASLQGGQTNFYCETSSDDRNNIFLEADKLVTCEESPSPHGWSWKGFSQEEPYRMNDISISFVPPCVLETVSRHLKFLLPESIRGQGKGVGWNFPVQVTRDKNHGAPIGTISPRMTMVHSYHCDLVIDPFWPFCMFELRGRCNDPECQWQHLKDCSHVEQIKHAAPIDGMEEPTIQGASKSSRGVNSNTAYVPTYRIGSILIKAENFPCKSLIAHSNWPYWKLPFCTFFTPLPIQRYLPSDAPVLRRCNDYTDDNIKRLSISSLGIDEGMKSITTGPTDPEQAVELSIDLFNTKTNKALGRKKALSILSRSLEANPSFPVLWIIYLNIYYRKEKDLEDDDMFLIAVQHCNNSYDLWLMYINSRMQFASRRDAYNEALHTLCHRRNSDNIDNDFLSACILDIFLQMVNFLCISGNVKHATSRIYTLLDLSKDSETLTSMLLIDILSCLVARDRCLFWICCIYLVVYEKLPQEIVQLFEFEKDISFDIEWPVVQLTSNEDHLAFELMRLALDNLDLNSEGMSFSNDSSQRSIKRLEQFVAVSHVRFVAATQNLESAIPLFDRYLNKYPTCIELIKLSANYHRLLNSNLGFKYFEQALSDWPKEVPGIQCLWNQYAGYALDCNRTDVVEELMVRWFSRFCKIQGSESGKGIGVGVSNSADFSSRCINDDNGVSGSVLPHLTLEVDGFSYNQDDIMFGFVNLLLYEVLQGDIEKARAALDRALKEATFDNFKHSVREHSSFCLTTGSSLDGRPSVTVLTLLNDYLGDVRYSARPKLLSRKCYQHLKKPRLRHLIDTLLGPLSSDCSLVNSVLSECYGTSLLAEIIEPKKLIDYVEYLMEISPANYQLAISVYNKVAEVSEHAASGVPGIMFWASTLLVNSIIQSFPVAPEHAWAEAANLLSKLGVRSISERFHQHGLSVYPFSKKLWQSYYHLSKITDGNPGLVVEAAKERGIELT